jgi:hypothetical protein
MVLSRLGAVRSDVVLVMVSTLLIEKKEIAIKCHIQSVRTRPHHCHWEGRRRESRRAHGRNLVTVRMIG